MSNGIGEVQTRNQVPVFISSAGSSVGNISSVSGRQLPSPSRLPPSHAPPSSSTSDMQQYSPRRFMSSSTSDVQSVSEPRSRVVCPPPQVPVRNSPVHEYAHSSLTRGSARTADERLGVWACDTTIASSMPSIPRECAGPSGDIDQAAAEPPVTTKDWLDSLHRKKNVLPISKSTDQVFSVSLNPAGGSGLLRHSAAGDFSAPVSRSTLAGSDESFAIPDASSRQSLNSRDSVSSLDKKRHVRFELQPTTIQRAPASRQRSTSRSRKQQRHSGERASETDRARATDDDDEGQTGSRASTSLFSKFRRVVADGVGSLFGLAKQKNNAEDLSDAQPTCNGHLSASSFEDMTEMERLATVADRVASERLHSAVLHGKLPTENGCRSSYRSCAHPELLSSDVELENMEARFAGLSISSVGRRSRQTQRLPCQKQQDFASWCGDKSKSVSEELYRLPSNTCSSYVQFMPKPVTVPCSVVSRRVSDVEPSSNCRKPCASSSVDNVVAIECQCGTMVASEPVLPTSNFSDASAVTHSQAGGAYSLDDFYPSAEPSAVSKSASQPTTVSSLGPGQRSSVTAGPKQNGVVDRSTSDTSRVQQKPQPPPKVFRQSSTNSFREGLLPAAAGVDSFRIRRQVGTANHNVPQSGPMKATVPYLRQPYNVSMAGGVPLPVPPPPPTRIFTAADVGRPSTASDIETSGMTLQELSAIVDRELHENERLELNSNVDETLQPSSFPAEYTADILNNVDSSAVSTGGWKVAVQSKDDVDAQLKSMGFNDDIWNLQLDEVLGGKNTNVREDEEEEEDSASTLTDCSVVTVTEMPADRRSKSPSLSNCDQLQTPNGCGSDESAHRSVDDSFSRSSKPSAQGSGSSHSLPVISDVLGVRQTDEEPDHPRCCSTNIPVSRTCGEDARERRRMPVAVSFNQLKSAAAAPTTCSPYNSNSSGIGSLFDSGSIPSSPLAARLWIRK